MGGDGRGEKSPLMTTVEASGAREYVVPCRVMAGDPARRVCEDMMNSETPFAVISCELGSVMT